MKSIPLAFCVLFAAGAGAFAQEPSPPKEAPPDPPLIAAAAAESQWTITYTPKTPEKEPVAPDEIRARKLRLRYNPFVLAKRVLKKPGQMYIYTGYEAGLKSEAWIVNGYMYGLPLREGEGINVETRAGGDFPEIYWISEANFRSTVEFKGRKVHLYETDAADTRVDPSHSADPRRGKVEGEPPKPVHKRAYIDSETRLPVVVDAGTEVWTYQFSQTPPNIPEPDERIKKLLRNAVPPRK